MLFLKGLVVLSGSWFPVLGEDYRWIVAATRWTALHVYVFASRPFFISSTSTLLSASACYEIIVKLQSYQDRFIDVLLESLVSSTVTMEHEYVSLLFSVDGLRHPLLHNVACERRADGDYFVSQFSFEESRVDILIS
jgi:hypothetical protein